MDGNFAECVDFVIDELEGGDRIVTDSGQVTKFGIAAKYHPGLDIPSLTRAQATDIYERDYWLKTGCDTLAWPMDLIVFDAAVNQGVTFAASLKMTAIDYVEALMMRIEQYAHLVTARPGLRIYMHGWVNRVLKIWWHVR